mmetsp:Transcript_32073/g.63587  ORF Transcript_32073/g.63587 Transcript_32073/m.63587 type:complete len:271 (+) Transcript_32073:678-1490(+)
MSLRPTTRPCTGTPPLGPLYTHISGLISARRGAPINLINIVISSFKREITFSTPGCPYAARLHNTGRPIPTPVAPMARHLNTSVALLIPPSTNTSTGAPFGPLSCLPSPPYAALSVATTSGNTSIPGRAVSTCRPPWLERMSASAPLATPSRASAPDCTPLSTSFIFPPVSSQRPLRKAKSFQSREGSMNEEIALAIPSFLLTLSLASFWMLASVLVNLFLMSRSLLPNWGASTVTHSARHPLLAALRTCSAVMFLSLFTYSCIQNGCPG